MFQVCRSCGCSNFSACPGQCYWVDDDLCSSCATAVDVETGHPWSAEEVAQGWRFSESEGGLLVLEDAP